ncbi:TPA: hypothetical protein N0F65_012599 [Lagenidium giganteum]|uniref:Uncharacterized protein n=1 Tax=Lagenidium giganteum TaxID=4803 RepID=A0AAV2YSP5_9STRA|nr:TPA: hypothetical protein N0F65_012599 [Lagenidium giganteum]
MMQEADGTPLARKRLPRLQVQDDGRALAGDHASASDDDTVSSSSSLTVEGVSFAGTSSSGTLGDSLRPRRTPPASANGAPVYAPVRSAGAHDQQKLLDKAATNGKSDGPHHPHGDDDSRASIVSDDSVDDDSKLSRYEQLRRWLKRINHTFSGLAINYFFKDELGLQPAESQTLTTLMMFPWGIKPVFGIISDSLPLLGYHRKSYMVLFSVVGCLAFLTLSIPKFISTPFWATTVLLMNNLSTAVIDVVIDARVVEMSRLDPRNGANDLQSVSWTMMSIGGVLGAFLSGPATEALGVRGVFFFAATGPFIILCFSLAMHENRSGMSSRMFVSSAKRQLRQLKGAITTPVIWKCALWVFVSGASSPGYSQVTFYYTTDVLKFTPEFLGLVGAFGYIFLLVGTLIYNTFFKDISFRRIFFIAQVALAVVSMLDVVLVTRFNLQMGIPDKAFVLGDAVIADVIGRLKTMPVLVLCAKLCPKGVEGTLFALLMSISNFSYSVSEFWGAIICSWLGIAKDQYDNLWIAIVLRSVLKIVPIAFLFLIPTTDPQEVVDKLDFESDNEGRDSEDSSTGVVREDHVVKSSPSDDLGVATPPPPQRSPAPVHDDTVVVV